MAERSDSQTRDYASDNEESTARAPSTTGQGQGGLIGPLRGNTTRSPYHPDTPVGGESWVLVNMDQRGAAPPPLPGNFYHNLYQL